MLEETFPSWTTLPTQIWYSNCTSTPLGFSGCCHDNSTMLSVVIPATFRGSDGSTGVTKGGRGGLGRVGEKEGKVEEGGERRVNLAAHCPLRNRLPTYLTPPFEQRREGQSHRSQRL